jgi:hypothetical protein
MVGRTVGANVGIVVGTIVMLQLVVLARLIA